MTSLQERRIIAERQSRFGRPRLPVVPTVEDRRERFGNYQPRSQTQFVSYPPRRQTFRPYSFPQESYHRDPYRRDSFNRNYYGRDSARRDAARMYPGRSNRRRQFNVIQLNDNHPTLDSVRPSSLNSAPPVATEAVCPSFLPHLVFL